MSLIGVRELREQASEVIRRVRQDRAEYVITYQGRPVAIILPLDAGRAEKEMVQASKKAVLGSWERYERLAEELRRDWPADLSTQGVIDSIRR
jgi:prevent-host-death family protein